MPLILLGLIGIWFLGRRLAFLFYSTILIYAAFTLVFSADWWQHAIHANPHIWTGVFLAFNLYCLPKWDAATRRQGDTGTRRRGDAARNGSSVAPSPPRTSGSSFCRSPPDWG